MQLLSPPDFNRVLGEIRPMLRNYGWMRNLVRLRMKTMRQSPPIPLRLISLLRNYGDPSHPYFIGTTWNGIRYLGDYRDLDSMFWLWERYDYEVLHFIESMAKGVKDTCLDVGTNAGVFAATMARAAAYTGGTVIAFEPVPETARRAAATFALNGLSNVLLICSGVGSEDGEATIFLSAAGHSGGASLHTTSGSGGTEIKIPIRSLDSLLSEGILNDRVGFIKIDVEGHEYAVLSGAEDLLQRDRPAVLYEYNYKAKSAGWSAENIASLLTQSGAYSFRTYPQAEYPPTDEWAGDIFCEPVR